MHTFCFPLCIAFHPDSTRTVRVLVDGESVVDEWEGVAGEELQEIPGVEGAVGSDLTIEGVLEVGEYLGILEVFNRLLLKG